MFQNQKVDISKDLWIEIIQNTDITTKKVMEVFLYLLENPLQVGTPFRCKSAP